MRPMNGNALRLDLDISISKIQVEKHYCSAHAGALTHWSEIIWPNVVLDRGMATVGQALDIRLYVSEP